MSSLDTDATLDATTGPDGLSRAGQVLFSSLEQRMFGQSDVQRLGRYHLIDTLGRGAMGIVYRAYDPDLDRRVAIKVVTLDGEEARARMVREAKALAKLREVPVWVNPRYEKVRPRCEYHPGAGWLRSADPHGDAARRRRWLELGFGAAPLLPPRP